MGWSRGSEIAGSLWGEIRGFIPEGNRKEVAVAFVEAFESADCDTMEECEQLIKDAELESEYFGADYE